MEGPKKQELGIAFLDSTTVAAGDIASVKGAIDRLSRSAIPARGRLVKVNQWSNSQDAWGITTVPPASLAPPMQTATADANADIIRWLNVAQNVQTAAGGVKFGAQVVFSGEAQCDTAQNATTLGDMVKLLINLAQMQAGQDATAAALIKSVAVTADGNVLKVSASLPQDVFQQMLQPHKKAGTAVHQR